VNVIGVPGQVPRVGVTVIVDVIVFEVELVATNEEISPLPDAAKPVFVLSFDQLKVAPAVPAKEIKVVLCPAHNV
jgi:hypothetical protein